MDMSPVDLWHPNSLDLVSSMMSPIMSPTPPPSENASPPPALRRSDQDDCGLQEQQNQDKGDGEPHRAGGVLQLPSRGSGLDAVSSINCVVTLATVYCSPTGNLSQLRQDYSFCSLKEAYNVPHSRGRQAAPPTASEWPISANGRRHIVPCLVTPHPIGQP